MSNGYLFQVFIAGVAPDTQTFIVDIKDKLTDCLGEHCYRLKVIDVLENPQLAEAEHILATPTLIRKEPRPTKRMILTSFQEDSLMKFALADNKL